MNKIIDHSNAARSRESQTPALDTFKPGHLRLARLADIRGDDYDGWDNFVGDMHHANRKLDAVLPGRLAVTIIGGRAIHSMLSQHYDRTYSTRKGARTIQSGLIDTFKTFVKEKRQGQSFADTTITFAERLHLDAAETEKPVEFGWAKTVEDTSNDPRPWRGGKFVVDSYIRQFGGGAVAVSLYPNPSLHEEYEDAVNFFKEEKLNTSLITGRKNFHPHATILRAERPLTVNNYHVPRKLEMPAELQLTAPSLAKNN